MKIKNTSIKINGHWFDYELEDGTLLHDSEWNGEDYTVKENRREIVYKPIYNDEFDIVEFDKIVY